MPNSKIIKVVFLGDPKSNKTEIVQSILSSQKETENAEQDSLTYMLEKNFQFSNFTVKMKSGKKNKLNIYDTNGNDEFMKSRQLCYPQTDVFVICYDSSNKESLGAMYSKYIPEVMNFFQPIIAITTKSTLFNQENFDEIGKKLMRNGIQKNLLVNFKCTKSMDLFLKTLVTVHKEHLQIVKKKFGKKSSWWSFFKCCYR